MHLLNTNPTILFNLKAVFRDSAYKSKKHAISTLFCRKCSFRSLKAILQKQTTTVHTIARLSKVCIVLENSVRILSMCCNVESVLSVLSALVQSFVFLFVCVEIGFIKSKFFFYSLHFFTRFAC